MLGLKLHHVSKRGPRKLHVISIYCQGLQLQKLIKALNYKLSLCLPWPFSMHIKHFQWIHDIIKNIAFLCALLYISLVVIPLLQRSWKGSILQSPCPSVGPSVRLSARLWTESCPLRIFNNTRQIHFMFTHPIMQLKKVRCVFFFFKIKKIVENSSNL